MVKLLPLFKQACGILRTALIIALFSGSIHQMYAQGGGCVCTNCPQFMPDGFVGDFLINVQGADNPTLGQNGQGVCGVNLNFDHEYIGDLTVTLTSPAGQTVTLIGPEGFWGSTDGTAWNISFVPCGDPANPDPGFADVFNNNQPWGENNSYSGSYHPFLGCLENFNTGPVDGTWTLTVNDGQAIDVGNFYDYEIIFCDGSGINCFSCAADAGELTQPNVTACQGSASLNLNLPPTYTPPAVAPGNEYSYTYVIGGAGGVILAYDPGPDLSSYDPGVYTVCGLSYLTAQEGDIPPPDGSLTITALSTDLNGGTPPFCGDMTSNCVNVTVNENPPDEEETVEVCAPGCYVFHGLSYCQTGTYVRNLTTPQGCPYTATLYLTVIPLITRNITEIICEGECAQTPGFEDRCAAGNYQETFTAASGCDSIVNLNLQILNVNVNVIVPGDLNCNTPTMQLSGAGSSIGAGVTYQWTASNGGHIVGSSTNLNVLVDDPGDYQLRVCRTGGGTTCCDSVEVTVIENIDPPDSPAPVSGPSTLCQGATATFTGTAVADALSYVWTVPPGVLINGASDEVSVEVVWNSSSPGQVCISSINDCGTSAPVCQTVSITPSPAPNTPQGAPALCAGAQEAYSIPALNNISNYHWTVTGGTIASGQGTTSIIVNWGAGGAGQVCVNATGTCGTSQDVCLPVQINTAPQSPLVAGNINACPGDTAVYTVANIAGAGSYNWTVTNGSIVSGQGSNTVQVLWDANAASGIVCANASNNCGASSDNCFNVSLSIPLAGQITTQCDSANENYTVSFAVSGGTAPYTIAGGNVANGVFTSNAIVSGQPYSFQIVDANGCVSAMIAGQFNCACATSAGSMDLAPISVCADQQATATHLGGQHLDGNDVSSFVLHSGSGTSVVPPIFAQNTTGVFGFQAGMNYEQTYYISFVAGNNLASFPDLNDPCLSVAQGQPVVFHEIPVALAGVDRDTCALTLTLNANSGPGAGQWAVISAPLPDTLAIVSAQNPTTGVSASGYGEFALTWTLNNSGCADTDTLLLDFNGAPSVTGLQQICDPTNENYVVTFQISGGTPGYTTTGTPGGTSNGNTFTSDPIANFDTYTYVITDSAGCASAPLSGVFSCECTTDAGHMELTPLAACEGGSVTAQHQGDAVLDANDTIAYVLHTLAGASLGQIFAENQTGVFDFQPGMSYGVTYYISVIAGNIQNGLPDTQDPCLSVAPGQPVVFYQNPVADAGMDQSTCGTQLNTSAVQPSGALGQWTVNNAPSGGSLNIVDPQSAATAAIASGFGTYTLNWTITQNGCIGVDQVNLQFNDSPLLSDLQRSCDTTNENFTVTLTINGGTAPYSVNGQAVAGNIFVSPFFANGQSYTFNVEDANGCPMPQVVGAYSCNCATDAGTMSAQVLSVCEGQQITVTANNDANLDGNDITAYVLHNGAGPSLGQVYDQNTTGIFSFNPAQMIFGTTYYVSLIAGNPLNGAPDPLDPCFSVAAGQPVVWLQNPTPNAGNNADICGLEYGFHAANSPFTGAWTLVSGPGTAQFADAADPETTVTVSATGNYVFRWTEQNGACTASDDVQVRFNPLPNVTMLDETCDGTNTSYIVSFVAANGATPYVVSGLTGTFTGSVFTAQPLATNTTYTFVLIDANGCESPEISGAHNCDCTTDAGTIEVSPAVFCADQPATAVWNNDAVTDANDMVQFILHNGSGAAVGSTIFATNTQPSFPFGGNLQFGVTYYISAIAGNNNNNNVDLNDLCLSVTPGAPVQWKPLPDAAISGDATLCAGGSAVLSFSGTGTYPLTLDYSDGQNLNTLQLSGPQTVTLEVTPAATTTYSLINVTDGTLPACAAPLQDAATVTVNTPVSAGTGGNTAFCPGDGQTVQLATLLTGADSGGTWTEISANPSTAGAFNAATGVFQPNGQASGVYSFRYKIDGLAPCPDAETTVAVQIHPAAVADAGLDKQLNCNVVTADLGGSGTTTGNYMWLLNGDTVGVEKRLVAKSGGSYTLVVSSPEGCTDEDTVLVEEDNEIPEAEVVSAQDVRCNGENNGSVSVDQVQSTHLPVLYSLNGSPFSSSAVFSNLGPGTYTITLQDANGCESTAGPLTVNEPPALSANLGGDLSIELADSAHVLLQTSVDPADLSAIVWQPLLDSAFANQPFQHFFPLNSLQLQVTVIDSAGCKASDRILIRVEKPRHVFIPNIFNPDASIDNLLYVFGGKDVVEIQSFQIFDRWGEMVFQEYNFQPNDQTKGWDGTIKGQKTTPGVFVYYAVVKFIDGQVQLFKGDVTLVR